MTVLELYRALESRYPLSLRCAWDNDGLMLCPTPDKEVKRILFALDATRASIAYAAEHGCDVLLTHHPMLFRGVKSVSPLDLNGQRLIDAWQGALSVISFHTRLDAGVGGVNDTLAEIVGLQNIRPFGDEEAPTLGRIGVLSDTMSAASFADFVRNVLHASAIICTGDHPVRCVAVCGGDGKDLIRAAMAAGADTFVTGAAGYNMALDAAENGLNLIEAGHYHTEAPVLSPLAKLCGSLTGAECLFYDSNLSRTIL